VGGIPEGVENGVNGFLVSAKNVDELSKKLNILIKDDNLRNKFGNNSLDKISKYSMILGKKTENLIKLYKKSN